MKDGSFDEYLASILNNKPPEGGAESSEQAVKTEPEQSDEDDVSEDITDFAEKTIRLSGDSKIVGSAVKTEPEPKKVPPRPRPRKRVRRANYSAYGGIVLVTLVLCCTLIISLFAIVVGRDFLGIDTNNNEYTLYIESGSTVADVAQLLTDNGIIEYPEVFRGFAKFRIGAEGSIYPGDIDVKPSMSYMDILDLLTEAREAHETVTVTIIEGSTIDDAAKVLEENGVCDADEFTYAFNSSAFGFDFETYVSSSSLKFYKYEGFLFPDTYEFYVGDSVNNIVRRIKERTNEILNADVIRRCNDMGYTLDQIVTLASILQLESGREGDMEQIAGVFYNRLNNPAEFPNLQTDTSYRYIENVIKAHTTIDFQEMYDAYDTYVCTGLPVGALCNPGAAAIQAALYPAENSYYYFCSDSETGEFYYAETYEEHLANAELAGLNDDDE